MLKIKRAKTDKLKSRNADVLPSEVREDFTGQGKRRPEDRSQRPEIRGHSSGRPRWPAAASRLRVAGSSGLAPCALSHWISLRPVIAGSRPVSFQPSRAKGRRSGIHRLCIDRKSTRL